MVIKNNNNFVTIIYLEEKVWKVADEEKKKSNNIFQYHQKKDFGTRHYKGKIKKNGSFSLTRRPHITNGTMLGIDILTSGNLSVGLQEDSTPSRRNLSKLFTLP